MLIAGAGSFTNTDAVDVLAVPPFVELTVTELALSPVVVPVTVTLKEQVPLAASEPPLSEMVSSVGETLLVTVNVPPHCELEDVTTSKPVGKVSVKLTPVSAVAVLGFVIVNDRLVVFPVKIGFAVKDLAITGGSITVSDEVPMPPEVVLGPVSVEETLLLTFVYDPAVAPVTVILIVHVPLAAIVPPESEIVRGEVRVKVPAVQAVEVPDVTVKPDGSTSLNETPVKAVVVLGFVSVNVSVLVLPVPMEVGEKLLERFGT